MKPEDTLAALAIREEYLRRSPAEPQLRDMAKTVIANARVLVKKLGGDPDDPFDLAGVLSACLHSAQEKR